MLYVNTRDRVDAYTAYKVLHAHNVPYDGFFMPFHLSVLDETQIDEMMSGSFTENVTRILNYFFPVHLDCWSLECAIGKSPVSIAPSGQKVFIAELWHNPRRTYDFLEKAISSCLLGEQAPSNPWIKTAIEIAVLFGIFAECRRLGIDSMDIALNSDDFSSPLAAVTARYMGLPVRNIICCFQENSDSWNFIHHGEISTAVCAPHNLERFIFFSLGYKDTKLYLDTVERRGNYKISEAQHRSMCSGLFPTVVGHSRASSLADRASQRKLNGSVDNSVAIAYGGLQDYRAKTGESHNTLLLSYSSNKR